MCPLTKGQEKFASKSDIKSTKINISVGIHTDDMIDQIVKPTGDLKKKGKRKVSENIENFKKRKVLNVREMTDEEMKLYRREQYKKKYQN